ncbi:MAG: efflux RND transporter periplasmic adaptor subunit [Terriglobales bacterium]|jgi:HlyD family secretion protein
MKSWKKILIGVIVVVLLAAILGFTIVQSRANVVAVQTGLAKRQDILSIVSASGEIKPKQYVNVGANSFGKITKLYVREGDHVKKGDMLAQIENVQPTADVDANRASLEAARTDAEAADAALKTAQADLVRAQSDAEHAKLDFDRAQGLYQASLIAKQDFDSKKVALDDANAGVTQAQSRIVQAKAQYDSAKRRINQNAATLTHASDVLSKTENRAPFDGTVTNLPVREGETVVVGIQNALGSTLMTLADMSIITAEVQVDETDIVNVKIGQSAEVSIDAIPKKTFKGVVTEIGENALLRSTGVASSQSTAGSQEAKDFKVVVTLQDPPDNLRPGLSCTAKITTASRQNTLSIPIQSLTIRERKDLEQHKPGDKTAAKATAPSTASAAETAKDKEELQGVFVLHSGKADFVQVDTGISGATDIEVTKGIKEGDEIVTGSYKVLRSLRNGASVKVDNSAPKKEDSSS